MTKSDSIRVIRLSASDSIVLECDHDAFSRLLTAIRKEAAISELDAIPQSEIGVIRIFDLIDPESVNPPRNLGDQMAMLGCGAVMLIAFMYPFILGILQIVSWLR